jgi:type IV secretion system protein VirB4
MRFFAVVPCNSTQSRRKLYLLNSDYADLSLFFTILPGKQTS